MGLSHCDVERIFICHYQMGVGGLSGIFCGLQCESRQCIYGGKRRNVIRGAGLSAAGGMPAHVCWVMFTGAVWYRFKREGQMESLGEPVRRVRHAHEVSVEKHASPTMPACPFCNLFSFKETNKHTASLPRGFRDVASAGTTAHQ